MPLRKAVLLALALVCVACTEDRGPLPSVPTPTEAQANAKVRQVFEALEPLVGKAPLECNSNLRGGHVTRVGPAKPEVLATWFGCAKAASTARRPFILVVEHPPFEGWELSGIIGGRDGSMRAFHYYEGCCWPPTPELSAGLCESPVAQAEGWTGFFGLRCANELPSGLIMLPELWLRPDPLPEDLTDRLHAAAGASAIDCGLAHPGRSEMSIRRVREGFACAEAVRASGRPFFVLVERGRRSTILSGLLGTAAGEVRQFVYDTAVCGSPGCPERFETRVCEHPTVVERQEGLGDFACDPTATSQAPPSRRRRAP